MLLDNADKARAMIKRVAPRMAERPAACPSGHDRVLDTAMITAPDARDPAVLARLDAVAGRILKG